MKVLREPKIIRIYILTVFMFDKCGQYCFPIVIQEDIRLKQINEAIKLMIRIYMVLHGIYMVNIYIHQK